MGAVVPVSLIGLTALRFGSSISYSANSISLFLALETQNPG